MPDKKLTHEAFNLRVKAAMQGAAPGLPAQQGLAEILKQLPGRKAPAQLLEGK